NPVELASADQFFLAVFIAIDLFGDERIDDAVVDEAAVSLAVAGADTGDGDQTPQAVRFHCADENAGRVGKECGGFALAGFSEGADHGVLALDRRADGGLIKSVA